MNSVQRLFYAANLVVVRQGHSTLILKNLVPNRSFVADFAYYSESKDFRCDIVSDGLFAEMVTDVGKIPEWSFWQSLKTPIMVFLIGLGAAVLVGLSIASMTNEKIRELAFELLDVVSPTTGIALVARRLITIAVKGLRK